MSDFEKESNALRGLYQSKKSEITSGKSKDVLNDKNFSELAAKTLEFGSKSKAQVKARASEYYDQIKRVAIRKPLRKPKRYSTVWTRNVQDQVQMDLWDIGEHKITLEDGRSFNEFGPNTRYALLVVEVKSRKVWGRLLPDKAHGTVVDALRSIFTDMERTSPFGPPRSVNADGDFASGVIRRFFGTYGIEGDEIQISHPKQRMKNVLVERFIRTLRTKLRKVDEANLANNFRETFQRIIDEYNDARHSNTNEEPNDVFSGKEDSSQGMPPLKKGSRLGSKFTRKGIRKGKSTVQQVIHPLEKSGVGKTGWQIGDFVRIFNRPTQDDKFNPKEDAPKFDSRIFMVVDRYKRFPAKFEGYSSKQTYTVAPLIMTGEDRGTVGAPLRVGQKVLPLRGWEMKKVTQDSEELRRWINYRDNPDARPVRRPAAQARAALREFGRRGGLRDRANIRAAERLDL